MNWYGDTGWHSTGGKPGATAHEYSCCERYVEGFSGPGIAVPSGSDLSESAGGLFE
ncbi:hypothetical protein [Rubritalea tangerina]|uniref:hypothetical protein n=1 Tax=Rubritalea tangerina TaxID=430798 RepID=UPI003623E79D